MVEKWKIKKIPLKNNKKKKRKINNKPIVSGSRKA